VLRKLPSALALALQRVSEGELAAATADLAASGFEPQTMLDVGGTPVADVDLVTVSYVLSELSPRRRRCSSTGSGLAAGPSSS
jgi:hypothetical protein